MVGQDIPSKTKDKLLHLEPPVIMGKHDTYWVTLVLKALSCPARNISLALCKKVWKTVERHIVQETLRDPMIMQVSMVGLFVM